MKKTTAQTAEIPIDVIDVTDLNIRRFYTEATIGELGKSISATGQIYPIFVRPGSNGRYELVFGSRRLYAARLLRLEKITATVADVDDRQAIMLALSENIQREDLNPFEEAWGFLKLVNDHKMKLKDIADGVGYDEAYVRRRIQLISMPEEVQGFISQRQLGLAHVDALVRLGTPEDQVQFARSAARHGLSTVELSRMIKESFGRKQTARKRTSPKELSSEKVRLKIRGFTEWLENVLPNVLIMGGREVISIKVAIRDLEVSAGRAIDQITRKYGKE